MVRKATLSKGAAKKADARKHAASKSGARTASSAKAAARKVQPAKAQAKPAVKAAAPAKAHQAKTVQLFQRAGLVQTESNVTVLQAKLPCVPCGRAGCEDHRQSRSDCLAAITPQQVLEQALRLLTRFDSTKTQPGL